MADVTLTYKGATIAELSESGSKTLRTAGKYCEADIGVAYVKPGIIGFSADDLLSRNIPDFVSMVTKLKQDRAFTGNPVLLTASFPECTSIPADYVFYGCSNLSSLSFPKLSTGSGMYMFQNCSKLTAVAFPSLIGFRNQGQFSGCKGLLAADLGSPGVNASNSISSQKMFEGCSSLNTLVLRYSTVKTMGAINSFNGTPFASGGAGGTIYIPRALYDHLGDGTSLDYKSATNWSTLDGYGTITWAAIEGSIYETQYADGTPIT